MSLQGSFLVLQAGMMTYPLCFLHHNHHIHHHHHFYSIFGEPSAHQGPNLIPMAGMISTSCCPNFLWSINTYTSFKAQHKRFIFQATFLDFPTPLAVLWIHLDCIWLHVTENYVDSGWNFTYSRVQTSVPAALSSPTQWSHWGHRLFPPSSLLPLVCWLPCSVLPSGL